MKKFKSMALAPIIALTFVTCGFAADTSVQGKAAQPAAAARRLDINTATEEQLKALPGIGAEEAKRIISGRPYHQTNELKMKKVISADSYEQIKKLIRSLC